MAAGAAESLHSLTRMFRFLNYTNEEGRYVEAGAWEQIARFIPRDKTIWQPFPGNGDSTRALRALGFNVACDDEDFFESALKGGFVVTVPPFNKVAEVMDRLNMMGVGYILLVPARKLFVHSVQDSMRDLFTPTVIIPRQRIRLKEREDRRSRLPYDLVYIGTLEEPYAGGLAFA